METEVWVAIIGLIGVLYSSTVGAFIYHIRKNTAEVKTLAADAATLKERQRFHDEVTSPFYPVKDWTRFVNLIKDISTNTQVDRVLVLVAVNGENTPTHATCIWYFRQVGEEYSYMDIPLDPDYVDKLLASKRGKIRFKTSDAKNTLIGRHYENEGVTEAIWAMVGQRKSFTTGQVAYKYVSVATHDENGFENPKEIERLVDRLVAEFRPMLPTAGFGPI